MWFQALRTFVVLLIISSVAGCTRAPELSESIVGYWTTNQDQSFLEFGPAGLYAHKQEGSPLEVGTWSVERQTLKMVSKAGKNVGQEVIWEVKMLDPLTFEYPLNRAMFRRYQKSPQKSEIFDPRLVGLWKETSSEHSDLIEFTPRGTQIGLIWQANSTGQDLLQGGWARVARVTGSQFTLAGLIGSDSYSPQQEHEVRLEGERLSWTTNHKNRLLHKTMDLP